jgi:hypothetical protein
VAAVVRSASLAASYPPPNAGSVVAWAAAAGARAAGGGVVVPLPVLLDVGVLWFGLGTRWQSIRPALPPTAEAVAYDAWLLEFVEQCRHWLTARKGSPKASDCDIVPALVSAWPTVGMPDAAEWGRICAALQDLETTRKVILNWSAGRDTAPGRIGEWLREPGAATHAGGFWSAYLGKLTNSPERAWLSATFDHEAARMYLEAVDPEITSDQKRRIARLRRRRKSDELSRFPTSYEEVNPHSGAWMISTLMLEDLGEYKIVNGSDPRISSCPPALPPNEVGVHLCWAVGNEGLKRYEPSAHMGSKAPNSGLRRSLASRLQAFSALLFDDWRCALRDLPVTFSAHSGSESDELGAGGSRWRPGASGVGAMPPPQAVRRFFRRCSWASLPQRGLAWKTKATSVNWYCLVVLPEDMKEFGFDLRQPAEDAQRSRYWEASISALPAGIDVVIVLGPSNRESDLCRVSWSNSCVRLTPVRSWRLDEEQPDTAYVEVRTVALDLLLDALERMMR